MPSVQRGVRRKSRRVLGPAGDAQSACRPCRAPRRALATPHETTTHSRRERCAFLAIANVLGMRRSSPRRSTRKLRTRWSIQIRRKPQAFAASTKKRRPHARRFYNSESMQRALALGVIGIARSILLLSFAKHRFLCVIYLWAVFGLLQNPRLC